MSSQVRAPAPVIEVQSLVKRFGAFVSVDDLSMTVFLSQMPQPI